MAIEEWPEPVADHPTPGMHIWGWMSPDQLNWLSAQAAQMQSVVEVGSLYGRSAFALLTACEGPVYCIDPWPDPYYDGFMDNCRHFPNLVAIRGCSPAAAAQVPDVDMVFLDGDHEYEAVVADIEAWLPKTRKLLCGHDYKHPYYPGVARAVDETIAGRAAPAGPDTLQAIWTVDLTRDPPCDASPSGSAASRRWGLNAIELVITGGVEPIRSRVDEEAGRPRKVTSTRRKGRVAGYVIEAMCDLPH